MADDQEPRRRVEFDLILPNNTTVAVAIARHIMADEGIVDRIEKIAAARIDKTIAAIVEAKATDIVNELAEKGAPSGFVFKNFIADRMKVWAADTDAADQVINRLVKVETQEAVDAMRADLRERLDAEIGAIIEKMQKAAVKEATQRLGTHFASVFKPKKGQA